MKHEALIDSVARDMTDADPSAGFRARVVTSLPPQRRRWWLSAVIPAVSVAVLAWIVVGTRGTTGTTGTTGTRGTMSPVVEQAANRSVIIEPVAPVVPVIPVVPVVPVDDPAWHARAIATLPAAPPITFTSIQPIPISIAPITMEPIVFEPIAVPAIDPRSGGRE